MAIQWPLTSEAIHRNAFRISWLNTDEPVLNKWLETPMKFKKNAIRSGTDWSGAMGAWGGVGWGGMGWGEVGIGCGIRWGVVGRNTC